MLSKQVLLFLMRCGNLFEIFEKCDLMPVFCKGSMAITFTWRAPRSYYQFGSTSGADSQGIRRAALYTYIGCNLAPKMILSHPVGALL